MGEDNQGAPAETAGGSDMPDDRREPGTGTAAATAVVGTTAARRRRRRGGRGRRRGSTAGSAAAATNGSQVAAEDAQPGADRPAEAAAEKETPAAPRARRARPAARSAAAEQAPAAEEAPAGEPAPEGEAPGPDGEARASTAARRRRRRGGRGRSRSGSKAGSPTEAEEGEAAADAVAAEEPSATEGAAKRAPARRRRTSAGTRAGAPGEAAPEQAASEEEAGPAAPTRTRRRRTTAAAAEAEEAPPTRTRRRVAAKVETEEAPPTRTRRRAAKVEAEEAAPTRTRRRRLPGRRRREAPVVIERVADKVMLVTELEERDQIAVLQDRLLVEHYITRKGATSMVGNIYLGKVQNVLPGMEAAFVDVGRGRNAVLYAGEVSYDEEIEGHTPRIEHMLRSGQNVLVQVTKDPIGGKGARLTQEISLPGRFVVFVPNSQTFGISRRLPDRERQRLKGILKDIKPEGDGLIVRTAAEGASAEDLTADLGRLTASWAAIEKSAKRGHAPRVLYEEPELTIRVIRDLFNEAEFKELVTDSQALYQTIVAYLGDVAPELVERVRMYDGPLPVLEAFHVVEQIHKALDRKVWLPSGGYIVIDKTEAMTVIDVNTGKHTGKANLEETVTKTNLEAAEEIARQLRLRDIGGMILVDFIDMLLDRNKDRVIQTMKNAMAQDKTRSQVFDIGPLGILEVTRKRVSAGLLESFSHTCPTCEGRGIILDHRI